MRKFKTAILCTFISIAMLSTCGCSNQDSSNSNVASSTNATVTDAGKESDIENVSTTELADLSDNQEVSEETPEAITEENTTTESASDKKQETTTSNKKDEAKADNKRAETTQQTTTQNQSTTQATTQHSKPGNSGNNGNSQNNNQTATTSHSHTWVNHTKTVHHDAQYEDQEVTKYKKEEHIFCNTCGADITDVGTKAHDEASGIIKVNCGTDENPWWVETTRCAGSHGSWISVPYTEIEKVKVKDAYDEEIVDYQYCSGCGQRK